MSLKGKKRIALYARVSTDKQTTESQVSILKEYVARRDFDEVEIYSDEGVSGMQDNRPELDRLMADARRRRFDSVLVFKFDRFARSTMHLLRALEEFKELGIDFISYSEGIDTSTSVGKMVYTMVGAVAEFERNLVRERVIAGVRRAKEKGKRLGRRPLGINVNKVQMLHAEGKSVRQIAVLIGCSKSKIAETLKKGSRGVQNMSENLLPPSGNSQGHGEGRAAVQKTP